jgi:sec-independent protein translocase protein TatA
MPSIGVAELIVILMILLLVFGGSRLPQIGEGMGRAIRGFKRGVASDDAIEVTPAEGGGGAKRGAGPADRDAADAEFVDKS